jgi:hypothetical protein
VTDVQLVEHEGRVQVRVEFEIRPGPSSPWLKTQMLPVDSRVSVRRPRAFGRPGLDIQLGTNEEEFIEDGEVWRRTRGARTASDLDVWETDRQRTEQQWGDALAHFEDEKLVASIKDGVAEVADMFDELERALAGAFPDAAALTANLESARDTLHGLNQDVASARPGLKASLDAAAEQTDMDDDVFERISAGMASFVSSLDALQAGIEQGSRQASDPSLSRQVVNLRRQSAQLRASWDESRKDPSRGGSMLSWRRSRQHFHGGESATEFADSAYNRAKRGGAEFPDESENSRQTMQGQR